jgi:hypothetical protein
MTVGEDLLMLNPPREKYNKMVKRVPLTLIYLTSVLVKEKYSAEGAARRA